MDPHFTDDPVLAAATVLLCKALVQSQQELGLTAVNDQLNALAGTVGRVVAALPGSEDQIIDICARFSAAAVLVARSVRAGELEPIVSGKLVRAGHKPGRA